MHIKIYSNWHYEQQKTKSNLFADYIRVSQSCFGKIQHKSGDLMANQIQFCIPKSEEKKVTEKNECNAFTSTIGKVLPQQN